MSDWDEARLGSHVQQLLDANEAVEAELPSTVPSLDPTGREAWIATVVDTLHPQISGRVRVRWQGADGVLERWLPAAMDLPVRRWDRVLVVQPHGLDEPLVSQVVDGVRRPAASARDHHTLVLKPGQTVAVVDHHDRPVVELESTDDGPRIRLPSPDLRLAVDGAFAVEADRIELRARKGDIALNAADDIVATGEIIRLN